MKQFLVFLISYALVFSPAMAKDIVAPRTDEDINFVTKPGGVNSVGLKIEGSTGDIKLNSNVSTDNARIEFTSDVNFTGSTTGVTAGAAIADWTSGVVYGLNQLVTYSDNLYRANTAHTSGATFVGDSAYWDIMSQFVEANPSPDTAGFIQAFAGTIAPTGWAICDGSAVDSATYPDLYANIGETWGDAGDGPGGLFNLPNLSGGNRFLRAAGGSLSVGDLQADATDVNGLSNGTVPNKDFGTGSFAVTVGNDSHGHTFTTFTTGTPGNPRDSGKPLASEDNAAAVGSDATTTDTHNHTASILKSNFDHTHSAPAQNSSDTETRPVTAVVNYIIKLHNDQPGNVVSVPNATDTTPGQVSTTTQTFGGTKTFSAGLSTDTINEKTPSSGVTIDGLTVKDGLIQSANYSEWQDRTATANAAPSTWGLQNAGAAGPGTFTWYYTRRVHRAIEVSFQWNSGGVGSGSSSSYFFLPDNLTVKFSFRPTCAWVNRDNSNTVEPFAAQIRPVAGAKSYSLGSDNVFNGNLVGANFYADTTIEVHCSFEIQEWY